MTAAGARESDTRACWPRVGPPDPTAVPDSVHEWTHIHIATRKPEVPNGNHTSVEYSTRVDAFHTTLITQSTFSTNMDSHSPTERIAGEPSLAGDQNDDLGWETFKQESNAPTFRFRRFEAPKASDCGDGRYRGAHYPRQGYGQPL